MQPIRVLELKGHPYEMGYQFGLMYPQQIHEITEERIHLCSDPLWTGRNLNRERVMELAEACVEAHYEYSPELMQHLEGMSDATDLTIAELIIANGFTDFIDLIYNSEVTSAEPALPMNNCTAFMVAKEKTMEGMSFLGQTWDMHATATPYVVLLHGHPTNEPSFFAWTITGCVGMIGMNEAGIAVGINNLTGADGQIGVTWPFVCRKILAQDNIEDALACITEAQLAGAHNYLLMDAHGNAYNIEAMATHYHMTELGDGVLGHANRCMVPDTQVLERDPEDGEAEVDSDTRVNRVHQFLDERQPQIHAGDLMDLTRDRSDGSFSVCAMSEAPYYSETCCACVMRPATGEFWGVWGLPTENQYERFVF